MPKGKGKGDKVRCRFFWLTSRLWTLPTHVFCVRLIPPTWMHGHSPYMYVFLCAPHPPHLTHMATSHTYFLPLLLSSPPSLCLASALHASVRQAGLTPDLLPPLPPILLPVRGRVAQANASA